MARATTGLSYFTFGIVILGSLVFTVFVTVPQWGLYQDANAKLVQVLGQEGENQIFLSNLDLRTQDLEKYSADAKALSVALPDKFMQSNLWININELAIKSGVAISQIDAAKKETASANAILTEGQAAPAVTESATTAGPALEKWITAVKVRGSYSQIRAFITNLEKSLILSDLKELKLTPVGSGDKAVAADTLEATMTIRTYVQP